MQPNPGPNNNARSTPRGNVNRGGPEIGQAPPPRIRKTHEAPRPDNRNRSKDRNVYKAYKQLRLMKPNVHPNQGHDRAHNSARMHQTYRLHQADLTRLSAGKTGQSLRLAEQYRLVRKGDVARRMGFYNRGPHAEFYHGRISPNYHQYSFRYNYWGPSLFVGVHWYPRWSPWVRWTWGYTCDPYWDPRPIYCRPVVYTAAPAWVYWETPVWTPLPEAACGTWVDLPPAPLADPRLDLQLDAVRFVDPGHPEEKLGPRYRVWFRNSSNRPITQPFNVTLFAGNAGGLAAGLPQAGVRVTGLGAGEVQSVDIRLPVEVYAMGRDAKGNPTPFSVLHVLVDAGEEIAETTKANNGASLSPADVLPVDPASFELDPAAAKSGGEVVLAGEGFGPQPGQVLLIVGGKEIDAEILGWYDLGVRFTLPKLALTGPTEAEVVVVRGDRAAANPLKITLAP